ncbi:ABC transporter permease DevC [Chamaesiphon polymorphus]|uniref:ABC transporter n=1 Tax=Chamaesiphon polymorphus CCALA 037 TaxID=2107692 RepID=A0A2T1GD45_9CYAN|nr:ABC transporter permease DevC [Chamaesiphon polymorphus]PSB55384.1 ABC transporter [Chamaesiphon polymorphus CCALA 037]
MLKIIQNLTRRTPLGWLQLTQHKSRFAVAISGVAFADLLMLMQLGFQGALFDSAVILHSKLTADVFIISPQALNIGAMSTFPRRRLYQAMDITGVKSAEPMYVNLVTWKNPQTRDKKNLIIVGFNPDRPIFNLPEVNSQLDKIKQSDVLLFDRKAIGAYEKVVESVDDGKAVTTEIERRTVSVNGLFSIGSSFSADGHLMTSEDNYLRLFSRQSSGNINVGLLTLNPGYDPTQVVQQLKAYLPRQDIKVLTKEEYIAFEQGYWQQQTPIGPIFNLGAIMGFIVGVIIVYQVLSTDVNSHLREYATFKAMGYSNTYLLGIVFEEALILAVVGFIPGLIVSLGLYTVVGGATNLPIAMTVFRAAQVLAGTLIMCMLSGAVATSKVQAADPADMF